MRLALAKNLTPELETERQKQYNAEVSRAKKAKSKKIRTWTYLCDDYTRFKVIAQSEEDAYKVLRDERPTMGVSSCALVEVKFK